MLGPLSLAVALMSGVLFYKYLSHRRFSKLMVILLVAANAIPLMRMYEPLTDENRKLIDVSVNPRGISQQELEAIVLDEYLPRTAYTVVSNRVPAGMLGLPQSVSAVVQRKSSANIDLEVKTNRPGELYIARWFFPGWYVTVDGIERPVGVNQYGAVKVAIPVG